MCRKKYRKWNPEFDLSWNKMIGFVRWNLCQLTKFSVLGDDLNLDQCCCKVLEQKSAGLKGGYFARQLWIFKILNFNPMSCVFQVQLFPSLLFLFFLNILKIINKILKDRSSYFLQINALFDCVLNYNLLYCRHEHVRDGCWESQYNGGWYPWYGNSRP